MNTRSKSKTTATGTAVKKSSRKPTPKRPASASEEVKQLGRIADALERVGKALVRERTADRDALIIFRDRVGKDLAKVAKPLGRLDARIAESIEVQREREEARIMRDEHDRHAQAEASQASAIQAARARAQADPLLSASGRDFTGLLAVLRRGDPDREELVEFAERWVGIPRTQAERLTVGDLLNQIEDLNEAED